MVRSANDTAKKPVKAKGGAKEHRNERTVGDALRRVYSETVQETVPDTMLDLLRKLD